MTQVPADASASRPAVAPAALAPVSPGSGARPALAGMFAVAGLLCGVFTGRFPALVERFDIEPAHLSVVLVVWAVGATLATLAIRPVLARHGSAAVLRWAAPVCAVALAGVAVAPGYRAMLAATVVFGAAFGVFEIAVNGQGAALERVHGRPLLGGMHAAWGVGAIAGGALAAAAGHLGIGYAWSVAPLALCALPVTVVLARAVRRLDASVRPDPGTSRRRPSSAVCLLCAAAFAAFVVESSVADWSGMLLRHDLGASHAVAALGYPLFQGGLLTGRLATDRIRAACGSRCVIAGGGLTTAAAFAVAAAAPTPAVALVALYAVGVGIGPVLPTTFSAAGALDRRAQDAAIARIGAAGYTGLLAGPVLVATATTAGTLRGSLATVVIAFAAVIAVVAAALPPGQEPVG